jgi:hypothetical protein
VEAKRPVFLARAADGDGKICFDFDYEDH